MRGGGVVARGLLGNAWGAHDPRRERSTQIIRVGGRREMNRDALTFPSELCACACALTPVVVRAARDTSGLIMGLRCCVILLRDKGSQGWRKSARI